MGLVTYDAFDPSCSDVDLVAVTRRDLDDNEFAAVDHWFKDKGKQNRWVGRVDMRFVIDGELLDKTSRCCGFYHYEGKLVRHGSDGNPIIWVNVRQCGITLWGRDAKAMAPNISEQCLSEALLLELNYLTEGLAANVGDRSKTAFVYNAYAVLTACRILYSAFHVTLASKDQASSWAMEKVPSQLRAVIHAAKQNRLENGGSTTPELEEDACRFLEFVTGEVKRRIRP